MHARHEPLRTGSCSRPCNRGSHLDELFRLNAQGLSVAPAGAPANVTRMPARVALMRGSAVR
jgi:hypothetical protein